MTAKRVRCTVRTPESAATHRLYGLKRWQHIRARQLANEPLCRFCKARSKVVVASVCDHVIPHRNDVTLFWSGPFQSLCSGCHDITKRAIETKGYSSQIDADGWPTDENHPFNRAGK